MKDRLCFLFLINSVTEGWKYVKLASKASLAHRYMYHTYQTIK